MQPEKSVALGDPTAVSARGLLLDSEQSQRLLGTCRDFCLMQAAKKISSRLHPAAGWECAIAVPPQHLPEESNTLVTDM